MKTGHPVPGILTEGVFFVESDQHEIAQRVQAYDPDARLVVNKLDEHRLGIATFVQDPKWAPGGAWMIAFWASDQETGDPIAGEPDSRILGLLEKFDARSRNAPDVTKNRIRRALQLRELRHLQEQRDEAGRIAEASVHRWKQLRGVKHKIFVPASLAA